MSNTQIYIVLGIGLAILIAVALVFLWPSMKGGGILGSKSSQGPVRGDDRDFGTMKDTFSRVSKVGVEGGQVKSAGSGLTIEKKLKFAQWKMSEKTFKVYSIVISVCCFLVAFLKFNIIYQAASFFLGPMVMDAFVMRAVNKRFKRFDNDYAAFLLSLVGLLKTGMNPLQALQTAAESMEDESLVRFEVEIMLERLRLGVSEDKSIGAFGEDINHSEIELFVQALLLSRRVGGTLSDTLDRLAKQVRRRQYFRMQAVAAVGLQRGSVWFIISIMAALLTYIYIALPVFVNEAIANPTGWQVWQTCLAIMALGIFWVRKVSNIKV